MLTFKHLIHANNSFDVSTFEDTHVFTLSSSLNVTIYVKNVFH